MAETLSVEELPSALGLYELQGALGGGGGVFGRVHRAVERAGGRRVAVEVFSCGGGGGVGGGGARLRRARAEHDVLRVARHPNVVAFYGAFCDRSAGAADVWFVVELCACSARELARARLAAAEGEGLAEEHLAFILKGIVKGLIFLHENHITHRNIRGSNVMLSADGEVKLTDFTLSCSTAGTGEVVGSPAWMAPEVVTSRSKGGGDAGVGYDARADVWSLGVTAIELVDGRAPHEGLHPARALFQIARNPPPSLERPADHSPLISNFIEECLEKNPEHRPFTEELLQHPLVQAVPENDYYLIQELKTMTMNLATTNDQRGDEPECVMCEGAVWAEGGGGEGEELLTEDLAALDVLSEPAVLHVLRRRWERGAGAVYIGDTLLALAPPAAAAAPSDDDDVALHALHARYECASLADNAPHVFGVADGAYQRALHHRAPQHVVMCGETGSGKSTQAALALRHLAYLGRVRARADIAARVLRAAALLRALCSAATPAHAHSTRAVLHARLTYSSSGKLSGAVFALYQLEKWRVSSTDMEQANFDLLYYFYDAMEVGGKLETYDMKKGRNHRYLRVLERQSSAGVAAAGARVAPAADNVASYSAFLECLGALDWEENEVTTLQRVLAAVLLLGDVRFVESGAGAAELDVAGAAVAESVARLLQLDPRKFTWALLNYCAVERDGGGDGGGGGKAAARRRRSVDAARDARDSLAAALYARLLDSLVNRINLKLSFGRSVFGDELSVSVVDAFGFESFRRNRLEQLAVNTTNEQLHFLYCQRTFAWELRDAADEGVDTSDAPALRYYDNRAALERLMGRPLGLFYILDAASRVTSPSASSAPASAAAIHYIMSTIGTWCGPHVTAAAAAGAGEAGGTAAAGHEFSVAHYAGRVTYDARELADRNKDLVPPELVLTLRDSSCAAVRALFQHRLTRTGNLAPPAPVTAEVKGRSQGAHGAGLWSQTRGVRTAAAVYRASSLELLRHLGGGVGGGGSVYFVRCVRADLDTRAASAARPARFRADLVRHQIRALAVLDTARVRKYGFSCRLPFADFIRRFKFLAFEWEERVEETRDNCRLLLVRLKLQGWRLGRTRVFLKYYHEEYLARLYEKHVKKIVKVQCMMRAFLARKAIKGKSKMAHAVTPAAHHHDAASSQEAVSTRDTTRCTTVCADADAAAVVIQKAYRGYAARRAYGPLVTPAGVVDETTARLLRCYARKWRSRSVFQVLLQYRAAAHQRLVHFSQQVHMYNQTTLEMLARAGARVPLERVMARDGPPPPQPPPPTVWKLPFRLDQLLYRDTTLMCAASDRDTSTSRDDADLKAWDGPLKRRDGSGGGGATAAAADAAPTHATTAAAAPLVAGTDDGDGGGGEALTRLPFCREPERPLPELPAPRACSPPAVRYRPPAPWRATPSAASAAHAPDPVRELQERGGNGGGGGGGDDSPYNFQAMLRKTPRNRASMKRSGEVDDARHLQLCPGVTVLLEGEVAHV